MKYSLLPGIWPRLRELFGSGFSHLSFFMAHVYRAVRLLPPAHPYLAEQNKGHYGLLDVVAEARRNLIFKPANIDQIVVFFSLIVGLLLMALQCGLLLVAVFVKSAWAGDAGAWWARFFVTKEPQDDLAFITLDRVFGIPNIFDSRVEGGSDGPFPSPFHQGLHELFSYYSIGIFAVAIVIIIYYVITIVAETADSGTPFGRRFNGAWAPVRLILCIALLAPISHGMNIAQLGTLRVAKWGSGLATNAWVEFNTAVGTAETQLGKREAMIAIPNLPTLNTYLEWILVARTCAHMHNFIYDRDIQAYVVRTPAPGAVANYTGADSIPFTGASFQQASEISSHGTINVVFGEKHDSYTSYRGNVRPFCGIVSIQVLDTETDGALHVQEKYYDLLKKHFTWAATDTYARNIALRFTPTHNKNPTSNLPPKEYISSLKRAVLGEIKTIIEQARQKQINESDWQDYAKKYGWAGAGIWYNKVAQYNGSFFASVYNLPSPAAYPEVMERIKDKRAGAEETVQPRDRYRPYRADDGVENPGGAVELLSQGDMYIAQACYFAQRMWSDGYIESQQNAIFDYINMLFGTSGLFDMRKNIDAGVHPLAALVGIGSSLIESTIINLGAAVLGGALGGLGNLASSTILTNVGQAITGVAMQMAILGLSIGFLLFYVIPFLPFIYFFFAFSGWIKAVFEAMVGLPVWALAHLRIDGEGISGPMALDGFFLVFEIFIRPIVIIIALISSVAIFSAMVSVLNSIWELVLTNLAGHKPGIAPESPTPVAPPVETPTISTGILSAARGTVDYMFYTALYAIFIYMMALSSFKMIDLVPNYVLRWIGKQIKTIGEGEMSEDPGQSLLRNMFTGSNLLMSQIGGGGKSVLGSLLARH